MVSSFIDLNYFVLETIGRTWNAKVFKNTKKSQQIFANKLKKFHIFLSLLAKVF